VIGITRICGTGVWLVVALGSAQAQHFGCPWPAYSRPTDNARNHDVSLTERDTGCTNETAAAFPTPPGLDANSRANDHGSDGTVSVTQLMHPPSKRAKQAYDRAGRLSGEGRYAEATVELQTAVSLAPEFAEAHNNLGVRYLMTGRYAEALAQFEAVTQIAPARASGYLNLGWTLLRMGLLADAERAARRAVSLNGASSKAHLLLGSILGELGGKTEEAVHELQRAAEELPAALFLLSHLSAGGR
jgi:tetratricopeptide (TPR) repeat protein